MKMRQQAGKDLYFTGDHEWINFQGAIAYTGVCVFKLTGFKAIHQVIFHETGGFIKQGQPIATIRYNDYRIEAHMPADGKIVRVNTALVTGSEHILLQDPEQAGWIALINPTQPYERKNLLLPAQYRLNGKSKYAK